MSDPSAVKTRMIEAALALAAERSWRSVSVADIARRADVPLADAYDAFDSRAAVVVGLIAAADREVLQGGAADLADTPRDRLFEILMRRFDALQKRKPGIVAIIRGLPTDPMSALCALPRLGAAMAWMVEAAGLSASGIIGNARVKVVATVYLATMRVWLNDDDPDMAQTMAELDRELRRLEQVVERLPRFLRNALDGDSSDSAATATRSDETDPNEAGTPGSSSPTDADDDRVPDPR